VFQLNNAGAAAVSVDGMFATQGFHVVSSTCGATLAVGTSCGIDVQFAPATVGPTSGLLDVSAGGHVYQAQLKGAGGATVVVTVQGNGTVTSNPAGIDCGATCSALFDQQVELDAALGSSSGVTWSDASCGTALTCSEPPGTSVTATFAP
jgi:hypothetical protein